MESRTTTIITSFSICVISTQRHSRPIRCFTYPHEALFEQSVGLDTTMRGLNLAHQSQPSHKPETNSHFKHHDCLHFCILQVCLGHICPVIDESVCNKRNLKLERPTRWISTKTSSWTPERLMDSIDVPKRYRYNPSDLSNIFTDHMVILARQQ